MMLSTISRSDALRFCRVVDSDERLPGSVMAPMAGSKRVDLESLSMVEEFLTPKPVEDLLTLGSGAKLHYLDTARLVGWVRDTIGDAELAASLQAVAGTKEPYGLLVPELKQLLAARLAEYDAVCAEG